MADETAPPPPASPVSFGAAVRAVTAALAAQCGLPAPFGVEVGSVKPASAAEAAGIRPGDIITSIGAYTLQGGAEQFRQAVGARRSGDSMSLTIWRDGRRHRLEVRFP